MFKIITKKRYNELVERNASLYDELLISSRRYKNTTEEMTRRFNQIIGLEKQIEKYEEIITIISKDNIKKNQRVRLSKLLFSVFASKAKNTIHNN